MAANSKTKDEGTWSNLKRYFKGVKTEMKKVVWPSKEEIVKYSALVIALSALSAIVMYVFDFIIHNILQLIIG